MNLDVIGLSSAFDFGGKIVDGISTYLSKGERIKEKELEAVKFVQTMVEERDNIMIQAQRDIIVSEMNQSDNYTKRARPSIIYAGLGAMLLTSIFIPLLSVILAIAIPDIKPETLAQLDTLKKLAMPDEFWWAWSGVAGLWVIGRSAERRGSTNKIISMITGNNGNGKK